MKNPIRHMFPLPAAMSLVVLVALTAYSLPLQAQQQPEEQTVSFRVYLWQNPPQQKLPESKPSIDGEQAPTVDYVPPKISYIDGTGEVKPVAAAARRLSPPNLFKGANPLVFVQQTGTNAEGEPTYHELGRVTLPSNTSDVVLFFFPDAETALEHYRIAAVPASRRDLPPGNALVINLSQNQVAAKVGNEQFVLGPNGSQRIALSGIENSLLPVILGTPNAEGQWKRRLSQPLVVNQQDAPMLLLYDNNNSYRVQVVRTGN